MFVFHPDVDVVRVTHLVLNACQILAITRLSGRLNEL